MKVKIILSILVLALGIFNPAIAQDNSKDQVYIWDDFSGGLATKLSPFVTNKRQATVCENVRLDDTYGAISKRDQLLLYGTADGTEPITGLHRLYLKDGTKSLIVNHGDEIEKGNDTTGGFTTILDVSSGDYRWQWLTWNDVGIGTDGYNYPVKYDGSSTAATYLGSCLAIVSSTGTGPTGTFSYKVALSFPSSVLSFNVPSNSVTAADKAISLSMIPIGPDTYGGESIVGRLVYRTASTGTTYYLLPNGSIANNTAVTLTDTCPDASLTVTTYSTTYTCTPPKARIPLIHSNRLFLFNNPSNPSRFYYSTDGNMDYFDPTDYYLNVRPDDGDQIMFAKNLLGILTVGKENSIQKVYTDGSTPSTDWEISDPFSTIGCKAMYSAQDTPLGIMYLGSSGIYRFNGQNSVLVSDIVSPVIKDVLPSSLANVWSQYHKNIYNMAYASKEVGEADNNRVLRYDLINNNYTIDKLGLNCFTTFSSGSDTDALYSGSSAVGKVYFHEDVSYEVFHSKHSDFAGTFTGARYIPTGVAGGDANNPIIEVARTGTIDDMSGTINAQVGTIDRNVLSGTYVSQALNIRDVSSFVKLFWNESFASSSDNITVAIRTASSEAGLSGATWSSEYTDPSGSDISGETAGAWLQYRVSLTSGAYTTTPTLYRAGYVIKLTYKQVGSATETTIPLHWTSGWLDLGYPAYKKALKKLESYHNGTSGTLTYTFSNLEGDTDIFNINLADYPGSYSDYFTNGKFIGQYIKLDISNSDLNSLDINKIMVVFDVEPLV